MKTNLLRSFKPFGVAALLLAAGCNAPDGAMDETGEELYQGSGTTLWTNGVVPVCYATDGNNQALINKARYLLDTYGWSAVANVQFTGWGACGSSAPASGAVRLHFAHGTNGNTAILGKRASAFTDVTLVDDGTDQHYTYEVLHEFGHALAWDHEQQRPDNWPNGTSNPERFCNQNQSGQSSDPGGTYRTGYYDTQSIMSYCTGWAWQLSPGDVAGVQGAYGIKPGLPYRGANSSNNAASRGTGNLDTFFVHQDGSIWTSYWYSTFPGGNWPTFQLPAAGPNSAPVGAPIASVSRANDNLDIFYVNPSGGVNTNYWNPNGWGGFTLPGTANLAQPGEQVAAVSGSPGQIDVLYAGKDKNLYWQHWSGQCSGSNTQCGWTNPQKVVGDGSIPVGAAVSAVARTPDRLDVFYLEADGTPHTSACFGFGTTGGGSCNAGSFSNFRLNYNAGCLAAAGGNIAATARTANNIDIFYVNNSKAICTNYWNPSSGWNSFALTGNNATASWSSIAAVTRAPGNLDIFYLGTNAQGTGELHTAWWYQGANGWGTADIGGTYGGVGTPGGVVGAAARTANNLDAWAPGIQLFGGQFRSLTTWYWYTGAPSWTSYQTNSY